jgi:hypothetical protein
MTTQSIYQPVQPKADADGAAIASLIIAFFIPPLGIILGHVSRGQAKRAGRRPSAAATWGTVLGYVFTVLTVILIAAVAYAAAKASSGLNNLAPYPTSTL